MILPISQHTKDHAFAIAIRKQVPVSILRHARFDVICETAQLKDDDLAHIIGGVMPVLKEEA